MQNSPQKAESRNRQRAENMRFRTNALYIKHDAALNKRGFI